MTFQPPSYRFLLLPALLFFAGIYTALGQTTPVITCENVTVATESGLCQAFYTPMLIVDADSIVSTTYSVDGGASEPAPLVIPIGDHVVVATATAEDGASTTCSFSVVVQPPAPVITSCEDVTISNAQYACGAQYIPDLGIISCTPASSTYSLDGGFPMPELISVPRAGHYAVVATVTDSGGGSSTCAFNFTVEDREAPAISFPLQVTVTLGPDCTVMMMPDVTYNVVIWDNCGSPVGITQSPAPGSLITSGYTEITFTGTDAAGNTGTCTTSLVTQGPSIELWGQGYTIWNGTDDYYDGDDTDFGENMGTPITHEFIIKNGDGATVMIDSIVSSNPENFVIGALDPPGGIAVGTSAKFPVTFVATTPGIKTARIYIYSMGCPLPGFNFSVGGEVTCASPDFSDCPGNITVNAEAQNCQALVKYPITSKGLPEPTLSYTFSGATDGSGSGSGDGNYFNIGTTTVLITASNSCGSKTCSFSVQVNDVTAPEINCAEVVEAALDSNCQYIVPDYSYLVSNDCSALGSVTQSPLQGTVLLAGEHSVTLTASDIRGNSSTCTFILVVSDRMGPVITQAAQNTTVYCNATAATAFDNFLRTHGGATALDACTGTKVYWAHDYHENLSDSCGYTGSVTVTFVAVDLNGNGTPTSATFRILDITAPTLSIPGSITVACNASTLPADTGNPSTTDVCATASSNPESTGIWINELHYDQAGTDAGEFIEIGGPAGTNLTGSAIYLYRPSDGKFYHTKALSGVIPNLSNGRGVLSFSYPNNTIINGVGAICLVKSGVLMEFISCGAPVTAGNGNAAGLTSTPIGLIENDSTLAGTSLQRTGAGRLANTFDGQGGVTSSPGALNLGQVINPPPAAPPAPTLSYVDTYTGGPACPYVINRKWKATDECGNVSAQFNQKITVSGGGPSLVAENGGDTEVPSSELTMGLSAEGFALYQNVPNPWNNTTLIRFSLPAQMPVSLSVFDLNGKLVKRYEETFDAGLQGIYVDKAQLGDAQGMYYYKLESSAWTATRKMILVP